MLYRLAELLRTVPSGVVDGCRRAGWWAGDTAAVAVDAVRYSTVARRVVAVVTVTAVTAGGTLGATWWWADQQFEAIPTFDDVAAAAPAAASPAPLEAPSTTSSVPAPPVAEEAPSGTESYLVFSVGSAGLTAAEAQAAGIDPERAGHADGLADTILLVVTDPDRDQVRVLSIPRDVWLPWRGSRVNAVYNSHGVAAFAADVAELTGITPDHVIAVNFAAFSSLTDAVDGLDLTFDAPVRDRYTGLEVTDAGCHHFDGPRALSLVRSRHLQVYRDGRWRTDPSASDWGRIARQQSFLLALTGKLASPSTLTRIGALVDVAHDNLIIDESLDLGDVVALARDFVGGVAVETHVLPATGGTVGRAAVLFVDPDAAAPVLARVADGAAPLPEGTVGTVAGSTTTTTPATSTTTMPGGPSTSAPPPAGYDPPPLSPC